MASAGHVIGQAVEIGVSKGCNLSHVGGLQLAGATVGNALWRGGLAGRVTWDSTVHHHHHHHHPPASASCIPSRDTQPVQQDLPQTLCRLSRPATVVSSTDPRRRLLGSALSVSCPRPPTAGTCLSHARPGGSQSLSLPCSRPYHQTPKAPLRCQALFASQATFHHKSLHRIKMDRRLGHGVFSPLGLPQQYCAWLLTS